MSPEDFDYRLPPELIAQRPADRRRDAKLFCLDAEQVEHASIDDLPRLLSDRPLIVVNDSRVAPSRVVTTRDDGREFELLMCRPSEGLGAGDRIQAWVRGAKKLKVGNVVRFGEVSLRYVEPDTIDPRARSFEIVDGDVLESLKSVGEVPLPPYIQREAGPTPDDLLRYQTVFANQYGSVAAPTAGLHFDPELREQLDIVELTLHVGPGTFLPMDVEQVEQHQVGSERFEISEAAASRIQQAKSDGRPVMAVGTTVTRTLESVGRAHDGRIVECRGSTDLVITPNHEWRIVDRLMTNFHLPKSSLLMLTCSFGGHDRVMAAYRTAVENQYRFYSYGDAMLIRQRP